MNPKLFNGDADSYLAPENSSPLFLESADRVTIPLVLLADDGASGSLEGRHDWVYALEKFSFRKN